LTAALSFFALVAHAQDRGVLRVRTDPDSALVLLDDAKDPEAQKTPYANENMIPGAHVVVLRPADPAFRTARRAVEIAPGRTTTLEHVFEYRTKASGMELLSVAPWKLEVGSGIGYWRYIGRQGKADPSSTSGASLSTYPSDSIPSALEIPLQMRLGFPLGLELRASVPLAEKDAPQRPASLAAGDVLVGAKWTISALDAALDASYAMGSAKRQNLGGRSDAAAFSLIANRRWSILDLSANLGWRLRFHSMDTAVGVPGDEAFARARVGVLLFDRILPLVQVSADYALADRKAGADVRGPSLLVTATPGLVWYAGQDLSLEVGVPLGLLASNEETRWGLQASFAWGFSLGSAEVASARGAPSPAASRSIDVPVGAPSHVLFSSTEVTNAQYKAFCDKTGRDLPPDPEFAALANYVSDPRYADYPVVNVSIADARAYAAWAERRLPTVGEWRKEMEGVESATAEVACGLESPEPVAARASVHGLHGMVGNVAEWVENDRTSGSVAYMAGGFFSLPRERCLDKERWIDVASPTGARYIGFRVVTDVK
jgi:hypothetical protein